MNDLISRQAAIDASCTCHGGVHCNHYPCNDVQAIMDLPSAQQWIPCSERLPEVHESGNDFSGIYMQSVPVLVYGICEGEENAQFHIATYCDDLDGITYWSTELDALTITEVIAWMPLPESYKGEE